MTESGMRAMEPENRIMFIPNPVQILKMTIASVASPSVKYYTMPWTQGINGLLVNNEVVAGALGANWRETYPCRNCGNEHIEGTVRRKQVFVDRQRARCSRSCFPLSGRPFPS